MVILSIKGKSGKAPFVHPGRNFKTVERGMVIMAEASAAADVVLFRKILTGKWKVHPVK